MRRALIALVALVVITGCRGRALSPEQRAQRDAAERAILTAEQAVAQARAELASAETQARASAGAVQEARAQVALKEKQLSVAKFDAERGGREAQLTAEKLKLELDVARISYEMAVKSSEIAQAEITKQQAVLLQAQHELELARLQKQRLIREGP